GGGRSLVQVVLNGQGSDVGINGQRHDEFLRGGVCSLGYPTLACSGVAERTFEIVIVLIVVCFSPILKKVVQAADSPQNRYAHDRAIHCSGSLAYRRIGPPGQ
ncbi:hypothetical protein, partial [Pseudomonas sp. DC3000-4b1]|uniref:hypothetical protein n=1 Tax=unclassified Pseudomonas TaxID=196821 RepID=UPI003CFB0380